MEQKKTRMRGITNRWMQGNLLLTVLFLVLAETVLMIYTVNNSYSVARQSLENQIAVFDAQLQTVSEDDAVSRLSVMQGLLAEIGTDENTRYTMQLLDDRGVLTATSDGFLPQQEAAPADFAAACQAEDGIGVAKLRTAAGERILALSYLVPNPVVGVSVIRLIASAEGIDAHIWQTAAVSATVIVSTFFLIMLTGIYFIRGIVQPLAQVETTATKISQGNFDIRLENQSNDEIGRLCDTINHMAEELSKTERMKNEFISSVSHELRTPLTSIKGWTQTLATIDDVHDENYQHGMHIIAGETDRLYGMVEELLDFSRMQNKGLILTCEPLDIAAEVADAVLMVEQRAKQAGLSICYEEPEKLLIVNGDSNRLKQVFSNILDNAIKYSPPQGVITVCVQSGGENCFILISDQGQGIAPEELELVKTRFYKGKGSVRGSGIGLAVADEIVLAHGGKLELSSVPGQGTTVSIMMPLIKENV